MPSIRQHQFLRQYVLPLYNNDDRNRIFNLLTTLRSSITILTEHLTFASICSIKILMGLMVHACFEMI